MPCDFLPVAHSYRSKSPTSPPWINKKIGSSSVVIVRFIIGSLYGMAAEEEVFHPSVRPVVIICIFENVWIFHKYLSCYFTWNLNLGMAGVWNFSTKPKLVPFLRSGENNEILQRSRWHSILIFEWQHFDSPKITHWTGREWNNVMGMCQIRAAEEYKWIMRA